MGIDLNLIIIGESISSIKNTLNSANNLLKQESPKMIIICPYKNISLESTLYKNIILLHDSGEGIYQAMNLGLDYLKENSSYNWYLNSGDFAINKYLKERLSFLNNPIIKENDIIFFLNSENKNITNIIYNLLKKFDYKDDLIIKIIFLLLIFPSSHQNVFIKNSIHEQFDITYKYSADFNLLAKLLFINKSTVTIKSGSIATNSKGGITDKNRLGTLKERYLCLNKILKKSNFLFIRIIPKLSYFVRIIILFITNFIKLIIK